jgi:DNA end-binding protein Ku
LRCTPANYKASANPSGILPVGFGLLGTTLRFPYEVREASGYFEDIADIKIPADMRKLAEHILDSKATDFDPSTFVDQYEVALVDLLKKRKPVFSRRGQ